MKYKLIFFIIFLISLTSVLLPKNGQPLKLIAYPNPFKTDSQVLTIALKNKSDFKARVKATFYNFRGKVIYEKNYKGRIKWSGFDSSGNRLAPGVYFVRMYFRFFDGGVSTQWYTIAIR